MKNKKQIFLALLFAVMSAMNISVNAQGGSSCNSAITVVPDTFINPQTFLIADSVMWFSFVADSTHIEIGTTPFQVNPAAPLEKLSLYSGTCTTLTLVQDADVTHGDSIIYDTTLQTGNTYYLAVKKTCITCNDSDYFDLYMSNGYRAIMQTPFCPDGPIVCGNQILDPQFNQLDLVSNILFPLDPFNTSVCWWAPSHGTPELRVPPANLLPPAGPPYFAHMWSVASTGEGILTNVNVIPSPDPYLLTYEVRATPQPPATTVNIVNYFVNLANNMVPTSLNGFPAPGPLQTIAQETGFTNLAWNQRTVCFNSNQNWNNLYIFPAQTNATQVWLDIDNVNLYPLINLDGPDQTMSCNTANITLGGPCNVLFNQLGVQFAWAPATYLNNATIPNPTFTPPANYTGVPVIYTLTLTITVNNPVMTIPAGGQCQQAYVVNITVMPSPVPVITGFQNNCLNYNYLTSPATFVPTVYTASGSPGSTFSWYVTGGMSGPNFPTFPVSGPTLTLDYTNSVVQEGINCGAATICVTETDINGCVSTTCIPVYECCPNCGTGPNGLADCVLDNLMASDIINLNFPCTSLFVAPNILDLNNASNSIPPINFVVINGNFIIDVQNFIMRDAKELCFGTNARITVLPGCTLTIDWGDERSWYHAGCCYMWYGIELTDITSQLIITAPDLQSGALIEDARNVVVSQDGSRFTIDHTTFDRNNIDIVVNASPAPVHPCSIRSSLLTCTNCSAASPLLQYYTFTSPGPAVLNPALPRTNIGIEVNDVWGLTVGDGINSADQNIFELMDVGIWCNNSSLNSYNNLFRHIRNPLGPTKGVIKGYCIYSVQDMPHGNFLTVGGNVPPFNPNFFEDADFGAYSFGGTQLDNISFSTFDDVINGISIRHTKWGTQINLNQNLFNNFRTGISVYDNPAADIDIGNNDFNPAYTITQPSTAIYVAEAQPIQGNQVDIHDNTIFRVTTGILCANLNSIIPWTPRIATNHIYFDVNHPQFITSYGIRLQKCQRAIVEYNGIYRTTTGFTPPPMGMNTWVPALFPSTYFNPPNSFLAGISSETSGSSEIFNNYMGYLGVGIRCFNLFSSNSLNCNVMGYDQVGVWLDTDPIPGAPGEQGTPGQASDNRWNIELGGSFTPDADVLGTNSYQGERWYLRSTTSGYEWVPQILDPLNIILPLTASSTNPYCSYTIPAFNGNLQDMQSDLADIVKATRTVGIATTEQQIFFSQLDVYKELMYNDTLLNLGAAPNENEYIKAFYDSATNTDIGLMANIKFLLGENDTTGASILNSQITPANQGAYNERAVNEIYIATWAQDIYVLDSLQDTTLSAIAAQNPISGGPAVYTARVMLGVNYDDFGPEEESRLETSPSEKPKYIRVYPNPASDELNIDYSLGDNEIGFLSITDLLGRELIKEKLYSSQKLLTISTSRIEDGIYFLRLKVNEEIIGFQKLLIAR